MIRIGIVGAESSHSLTLARALNKDAAVAGARVEMIWGETPALARRVAAAGGIGRIVRRPEDLIGVVDAAVVAHRDGRRHLPAAWPLLRAGMPLFIDKPFCAGVREGHRFLKEAARRRVAVASYGVMPLQRSFLAFRSRLAGLGRLRTLTTTGPADLKSKYGGLFFYGVHQADMLARLAGVDAREVSFNRSGSGGAATVWYAGGLVATMNLVSGKCPGFHITASGERGFLAGEISRDRCAFLPGIRRFVAMFRGGRPPYTTRETLAPIAVMEAVVRSLRSGRRERVPQF